jgi:hypothetical protein
VVLSNLLQGAGVSGPGLAFLWELSLKKIGKSPIQNNCSELPDIPKKINAAADLPGIMGYQPIAMATI